MPWKNETLMEQKQRFVSLAGTGKFTVTGAAGQGHQADPFVPLYISLAA
jgi:hypothetical protein